MDRTISTAKMVSSSQLWRLKGWDQGVSVVCALFLARSGGGLTPSSSADGGTDLLHERRPPNLIASRGPHLPKLSYGDPNP